MKENFKELLKEESKNKLIEELHSLPNAVSKIKFWYKLGFSWLDQYNIDIYQGIYLKPFKFEIPQSEYEAVNLWILRNYSSYSWDDNVSKRIFELENLITEFEDNLDNQLHQIDYIRKEQILIDKSFEKNIAKDFGGSNSKPQTIVSLGYAFEFNFNCESFNDFIKYGQTPDYSQIYPTPSNVISVQNGVTIAQFRKYLDDRLNGLLTSSDISEDGSISQKLLLLQELGVINFLKSEIKVDAKIHKILSFLIGGKTEYLKKSMAIVANSGSRIQSKENLEFIANILDESGLETKAIEVRKRLENKYKK